MIAYSVPHSVFPAGYHCDPSQPLMFAALASQKNHMVIYLMSVYGDEACERWFRESWAKSGKKLDMGKACVRFKRLEDVALEVIGAAVQRTPADRYVARYLQTLAKSKSRSPAGKEKTAPAARKPAKKKAA